MTEHFVVSVPAHTEIYVVCEDSTRALSQDSATMSARQSVEQLRQLLQLQKQLGQEATANCRKPISQDSWGRPMKSDQRLPHSGRESRVQSLLEKTKIGKSNPLPAVRLVLDTKTDTKRLCC